jgi:penicillin-binding protein 2
LASNSFLRSSKLGETMKDNAWFVGFAPQVNPEIVVVALFEGGEHGQLAAPIVRDVIKAHFDKKERGLADLLASAAPSRLSGEEDAAP